MRKKPELCATARIVATNVRVLRARMDVNQTQLGAMIGLSRPTISRVERGSNSVLLETLEKLAAAFDVDITELFKP